MKVSYPIFIDEKDAGGYNYRAIYSAGQAEFGSEQNAGTGVFLNCVVSGTGIDWSADDGSTSFGIGPMYQEPGVGLANGILRVSAPVGPSDATTKSYVDARVVEANMPIKAPAGAGVLDVVPALANAGVTSTIAGVANRTDLVPFVPSRDMTTVQVGVDVITGVASSNVKVVVYASDPTTGLPGSLLGSVICSTATAATVVANLAIALKGATLYWIGVVHSSTATIRGIPVASSLPIGLATGTGTLFANVLRLSTGTYATPANPATTRTYVNAVAPLIRLRF